MVTDGCCQAHNDASLWRFLRAFNTADEAFKALLKSNKWRREFGVATLSEKDEDVQSEMMTRKAMLLRNRDVKGR